MSLPASQLFAAALVATFPAHAVATDAVNSAVVREISGEPTSNRVRFTIDGAEGSPGVAELSLYYPE